MWNAQTKAIPVIMGENGTVSEPFRQYLSNIVGKYEIMELRKQPYWALHILRKYWCKRIKYLTWGMQHKLKIQNRCNIICRRHVVCFGYIIVNTLHRGDVIIIIIIMR